MKKELLHYLAGLCQAASAALMASAVIMPSARLESILGCVVSSLFGVLAIVLKEKSND